MEKNFEANDDAILDCFVLTSGIWMGRNDSERMISGHTLRVK